MVPTIKELVNQTSYGKERRGGRGRGRRNNEGRKGIGRRNRKQKREDEGGKEKG